MLAEVDSSVVVVATEAETIPATYNCQSPSRSTGTRSPSRVTPVTSSSGEPIMKSMWIPLLLTRPRSSSPDGEREAVAERDVARRVLVEQRVVEDGPERADPSLPVDERELPEPRGALVDCARARERLAVLVGVDLDRAAALEAHPEAADDRAVA